jgi:hypothetical protein
MIHSLENILCIFGGNCNHCKREKINTTKEWHSTEVGFNGRRLSAVDPSNGSFKQAEWWRNHESMEVVSLPVASAPNHRHHEHKLEKHQEFRIDGLHF